MHHTAGRQACKHASNKPKFLVCCFRCCWEAGINIGKFASQNGFHKMIQNASGSNRQSDHHTRIQNTPRNRRKFLDNGHNHGDSEADTPRDNASFLGSTPQSHAVQWSQKIIQNIVALGGSNHQRKGSLHDQGCEFQVESLVALGVGEKEATQCVQAVVCCFKMVDCFFFQWNGLAETNKMTTEK